MSAAIPLRAVQDVLMFAKVRRIGLRDGTVQPLARCAAYTQNPHLNISCREAMRGHRPYPLQQHHFSPMHQGDMQRVLARVRCEHGLPEVKRTWGAGLRAMRAEFEQGVMR